MKNIIRCFKAFLALMTIPLFFIMAACSDDNEQVEPIVKISDTVLSSGMTFTKTGGTQTLSIKSNVPLEVTSDKEWCAVTHKSTTANGTNSYEVKLDVNSDTDDRTALITVTANGVTVGSINVKQSASEGLLVEEETIEVPAEGGTITVHLKSNAAYTVTITDSWIKSSVLSRAAMEDKTETFVVGANYSAAREGKITFTLGTTSEVVTVKQAAGSLPNVGMDSDAKTLAAKIKIGWNLGNAMEVPYTAESKGETAETDWGNPLTTKTLIDAVKAAGFNAVRIPCAWDGYIEDRTTYKIKESWMARVNEVVDYCIANEMYVILNTHYDGGWLENNPTYAKKNEVNKELAAIWTQIAERFKDYDEHLLFAGTNEVHIENVFTDPTPENNEVQQSFNQTFVTAVRNTGGNNAVRNLIIQAYNTNIAWGIKYLKMPTDVVDNRIMVEVHYYDPYNFALDDKDESRILYWGEPYKKYGKVDNWGQEDQLENTFKSAKAAFIDKGYPVILGEYGALRRSSLSGDELTHHLESRAYYLKTVTAMAKKYGLVPFYWDNGYLGDKTMAIFNRSTGAVYDPQALDSLMEGANAN